MSPVVDTRSERHDGQHSTATVSASVLRVVMAACASLKRGMRISPPEDRPAVCLDERRPATGRGLTKASSHCRRTREARQGHSTVERHVLLTRAARPGVVGCGKSSCRRLRACMPTYPRKRPRPVPIQPAHDEAGPPWLDVRALARIHASSQDPEHPVVRAFVPLEPRGWRAAESGPQVIDVRFGQPRDLTHIHLVFEDDRAERTQQFTISWSAGRGERHGEVVRQQFNFSPRGAVREIEDYVVSLRGIDRLEIRITPDINGGPARASLTQCRLA
jgi:hypothetical protein